MMARKIGIAPSELSQAVRHGGARVEIGVWPFLQWAFQRECARLEFGGASESAEAAGFGLEYVMIQRARLGCRVDGGGTSDPHPDADIAASALAVLPESVGGRGMAITLAECARVGALPDCMIGARPRLVPASWRKCKHGERAKVEPVGVDRWVHRGRLVERVRMACPVVWAPSASEIARARRHYLGCWGALLHLRAVLQGSPDLSAFTVSDAMPVMKPWKKS